MAGSCRISQHLRSCELGFYSRVRFCSFMSCSNFTSSSLMKPSGSITDSRLQRTITSTSDSALHVGYLQAKSTDNSSVLADCFSRQEDDRELPFEGSSSMAGGVVALGKFDALHIGHRELAIQASKTGIPLLLSFVGMAEVFGWEPRAPVVAKCDRKRVFSSWAPYCGNIAPVEFCVEFSSIRHLTPRQFVEKLAKEFGVHGVVAGQNYRFGYKAAGDSSELVRLCEEYGIGARIVGSIMDKNQNIGSELPYNSKERGQVSSTRVRHALAEGDMKYVSQLLGRNHRLILSITEQGLISSGHRISAPKSCLLNLAPKEGLYDSCSFLVGDEIIVPCKVIIDSTHIHLESDGNGAWTQIPFRDSGLAGIEFGDSGGV